MSDGELILSQTEDGHTRVQLRSVGATVWLTQAEMAELFATTPQNVTQHLRSLFSEGELQEESTCKDLLQVRQEGVRDVRRTLRKALLWLVGMPNASRPTRLRSASCGRSRLRRSDLRKVSRKGTDHNARMELLI